MILYLYICLYARIHTRAFERERTDERFLRAKISFFLE